VTGPEEDELPAWWRGPAVAPTPKPTATPKRAPAELRRCTRSGCTGEVAPPWNRRSRVIADDYCSAGCVPNWVSSGTPAPLDVWRRSGARA
jgi:hypothetical protein